MKSLEIDPKEWTWCKRGLIPIEKLFNYTTKRDYKTILMQQCR